MKGKSVLIRIAYPYFYICCLFSIVYLIRCAAVSSPVGGPKDTKAPKLVQTWPKQDERNVKTNKVTFQFNERVDAAKLKDKIVINPRFENEYDIEQAGKSFRLVFKYPLQYKDASKKNPYAGTYSFLFPDGIKDITEGNILRNASLSFSTSAELDTLHLSGYTTDFYKKDTIKKVLVGLYAVADSIQPHTHKPLYYTFSNDKGYYMLRNLAAGTYKVFAFTDVNNNLLYDNKKEKIDFLPATLDLKQHSDSLHFSLFFNDIVAPRFLSVKNDQEIRITFNEALYKYTIQSPVKLYHKPSDDKKEIVIFKTDLCEDTLQLAISVQDSSGNDTSCTVGIVQSTPKKFKTYKSLIKTVEPDDAYNFVDSIPVKLTMNEPVLRERDSSIVLIIDSLRFIYQSLHNNFKYDSSNTYYTNTYKINYRVKDFIQIVIRKKSIFSFKNDTNQQQIITLKKKAPTKKEEEEIFRANISLITSTPHFIYQLLDEKYTIKDVRYSTKSISYENLPQGIYHIRIIIDENNNRKWDSGNLHKKTYPEKVYMYKQALRIKKNWEVEDTVIPF